MSDPTPCAPTLSTLRWRSSWAVRFGVVGAFAVGPLASEWIGATVFAIKARIPIATLHDTPMQFPTFGEAFSYAIDVLKLGANAS